MKLVIINKTHNRTVKQNSISVVWDAHQCQTIWQLVELISAESIPVVLCIKCNFAILATFWGFIDSAVSIPHNACKLYPGGPIKWPRLRKILLTVFKETRIQPRKCLLFLGGEHLKCNVGHNVKVLLSLWWCYNLFVSGTSTLVSVVEGPEGPCLKWYWRLSFF